MQAVNEGIDALATTLQRARAAQAAGLDVDKVAPRLSFFFAILSVAQSKADASSSKEPPSVLCQKSWNAFIAHVGGGTSGKLYQQLGTTIPTEWQPAVAERRARPPQQRTLPPERRPAVEGTTHRAQRRRRHRA